MRNLMLLPAAALLVFMAACGGGAGSQLSTAAPVPTVELPATQLAGLPVLPAVERFIPQRAASAAVVRLFGAQADTATNHSLAGTDITFNPPAGQPAFGLYQFNSAPGEVISGVEYETTGLDPGEEVWVAIGDYLTGRWTFFTPQTTAVGTLNVSTTPGQFVSAGGAAWVLVVAFDTDSFTLNRIGLAYDERWVVSGQVVDQTGAPIADAVVGTPFASLFAVTNAGGFYTLGLPDGNWPLVVTKNAYTFYSNPQTATVAGADLPGLDFVGYENGANQLPAEGGDGNNHRSLAEPIDLGQPFVSNISGIDDRDDFFSFTVTTPGAHYLKFSNPNHLIKFPYLSVLEGDGAFITGSFSALSGTICVPVFVPTAPHDFIVEVECGGGGGAYSLSLVTGNLESLGGFVDDTGSGLDLAQVLAVNTTNGDDTIYITTGFFSAGEWQDGYRPAVQTTVTPSLTPYSFVPLQRTIDLSTGPEPSADFAGTKPPSPDGFEPNDTTALADVNAVVTLPFDSTGFTTLSMGPADQSDFYKFTPALGEAVRITVSSETPYDGVPLNVSVYEEDGVTGVPTVLLNAPGVQQIRFNAPADGGAYYIALGAPFFVTRDYLYSLQIEPYAGNPLQASLQWDGIGYDGASFEIHVANFTAKNNFFTDAAGLTQPILLAAGETADIELRRFGFNNHRHTRRVVMGAVPVVEVFSATDAASPDSNEPNNDFFAPFAVSLPTQINATLSGNDDFTDYLQLTSTTENALSLDLTLSGGGRLYMELYDPFGAYILGREFDSALPAVLLPLPAGAGAYTLGIYSDGTDRSYSLDLALTTGFQISGTMTAAGLGVPFSRIYCSEIDSFVEADGLGAYSLGVFEPGTYTLTAKAPGHTTDQGVQGTVTVPITVSDVIFNFTLTAAPIDADEPNDTQVMAAPATTDGSISSVRSIGLGADTEDWYDFSATAGQVVEIIVDWEHHWEPAAFLYFYDNGGNFLAQGNPAVGAATNRVAFRIPATGTYAFLVQGGGVEYTYQVNIN